MRVREVFTVDLQPPKLRLAHGRGRRVKHCKCDLVMFTRTREVFGGSENVGNAEARPGQSQPIQGLMSPPQTLRRGKEGWVGGRIEDTDESVISHTSHRRECNQSHVTHGAREIPTGVVTMSSLEVSESSRG